MSFDPQQAYLPPKNDRILSPRAGKHDIFLGPFGLRAGWGIALYVLITVALASLITVAALAFTGKLGSVISKARAGATTATATSTTVQKPPVPRQEHAQPVMVNESLLVLTIAFASFVLAKLERRDMGVYGLGKRRLGDVLPGAFWGLASLSLLVWVLRMRHLLVFDARLLFGPAIVLQGLAWLATFFLVGCFEEYFFRGYIQFTLTRGLFHLARRISPSHSRGVAFLLASVITSLLFYKAHTGNTGETASGLLAVFVAGVAFTYALWRTGSLWWGIGFHMSWDWAQSFLYGVPDSGNLSFGRLFQTHPAGDPLYSGGSAGPEGSLFVIPAFLLIFLAVRLTRPGEQPRLEPHTPLTIPLEIPSGSVA